MFHQPVLKLRIMRITRSNFTPAYALSRLGTASCSGPTMQVFKIFPNLWTKNALFGFNLEKLRSETHLNYHSPMFSLNSSSNLVYNKKLYVFYGL